MAASERRGLNMYQPQAHIAEFAKLGWDDLRNPGGGSRLPEGRASAAERAGVRRMTLAEGQCGFHVVHAELPPNHVAHRHRHSHDEIIAMRCGSIRLDGEDGQVLTENDLMVIPAHHYYGFTVGPEGCAFITVRLGQTGYFPDADDVTTSTS